MNIKPHPTKETLHALFDYTEDAYVKSGIEFVGGLIWRPARDAMGRANTRAVGRIAGWANGPQRRVQLEVQGERYELHRLIWIWHFGEIEALVDHRSRDTTDNRIENLRESTFSGNNANRTISTGRSSRYLGVYWHQARGKWATQIKKNGRITYLGLFDCEVEAAKARDKATKELHGEFGVLNFA